MGIHGGRHRQYLFGLALLILLLPCFINIFNIKVANASSFTNITTDKSALIALKSQLHLNSSHILSTNWSVSTPVCTWIGVSCSSRHHRVVALDISEMDLGGKLPPEIGNLSFIRSINLSYNSFYGSLPQEMIGLRRLRFIDLVRNNFVGNIPSWFQALPQLTELRLRNNGFDGELPKSIANISKLQYLDLSYNSLYGEIPKGIGSSNALQRLNLQRNQLSGVLPVELFNISSLEALGLTWNRLTGDLPADLCRGGASRLQELSLLVNDLGGQIPSTISECRQLRVIAMYENKFTGSIPEVIFNISGLQRLFLHSNQLTGTIPEDITKLQNLVTFDLGINELTGSIPLAIHNISTLQWFTIGDNDLSGSLPFNFGHGLPNLQNLDIGYNHFTGNIPESISNCSSLRKLGLGGNRFTGQVHSESRELTIITSLSKCRNLEFIDLSNNPLSGTLPVAIGNFPSLQKLYISGADLSSKIPYEVGNLSKLIYLVMYSNQLSGPIPHTIGNMKNLQLLELSGNKFTGRLPETLCELRNQLGRLSLEQNQLIGPILDCIGEFTSLRILNIANNKLSSNIPTSLWKLNDILSLNLSSNYLDGSVPPDIQSLKVATTLDLSMNQLSGIIPSSIGDMQNMQILSLAYNKFSGTIPETMGKNMFSLVSLNLSHNNLSGNIPISFESIRNLTHFDVSFNDLDGRIPSGGPFEQFGAQSFNSNGGLCGDLRYGVSPCPSKKVGGRKRRKVVFVVIFTVLGVASLAFVTILVTVRFTKYKRKKAAKVQMDASIAITPLRVSYYDIRNATEGFNESHLVGTGGSSSVYKGIIQSAGLVAIKVLNLQLERARTSFIAECEVLRSLRHRNLCKVIGVCSNESFKALILEYMPNGSLERWLYSEDCFLDIMQRIGIMIDVACALDYLHHGYSTKVVHCDVKPSNVLLDEDMVARLSDFGITKLLSFDGDGFVQTNTLATLGYIAPEYGSEGIVSIACDVYSYGIMMMEVFTRMKPSNESFVGNLNLRKMVYDSWPNEITRIIDPDLLRSEEDYSAEKLECLSSIMDLALACSMESPNDRLSMKDVVVRLKNIKLKLLPPRRMQHVQHS